MDWPSQIVPQAPLQRRQFAPDEPGGPGPLGPRRPLRRPADRVGQPMTDQPRHLSPAMDGGPASGRHRAGRCSAALWLAARASRRRRCCASAWRVLCGQPLDDVAGRILFETRLPRIILALAVGAAMGLAGLASQTLFRNPLASPYVMGVSNGAAVGAVVGMLLVGKAIGFAGVPLISVACGLAVTGGVFLLARRGRHFGQSLLLAGIAIERLLLGPDGGGAVPGRRTASDPGLLAHGRPVAGHVARRASHAARDGCLLCDRTVPGAGDGRGPGGRPLGPRPGGPRPAAAARAAGVGGRRHVRGGQPDGRDRLHRPDRAAPAAPGHRRRATAAWCRPAQSAGRCCSWWPTRWPAPWPPRPKSPWAS